MVQSEQKELNQNAYLFSASSTSTIAEVKTILTKFKRNAITFPTNFGAGLEGPLPASKYKNSEFGNFHNRKESQDEELQFYLEVTCIFPTGHRIAEKDVTRVDGFRPKYSKRKETNYSSGDQCMANWPNQIWL